MPGCPKLPFLLLALLALAGCSGDAGGPAAEGLGAQASTVEATATTGGIRGVVVDDAVRPIAGAEVKVQGSDKTTTSDSSGLFTISGLEAGTYVVLASHPLYDQVQQTVPVEA